MNKRERKEEKRKRGKKRRRKRKSSKRILLDWLPGYGRREQNPHLKL